MIEKVFKDMTQLRRDYPEYGNHNLQMDVISLSTLIAAWAKCSSQDPQAVKKAEEILHYMEAQGLNPTTITYNTVLKCLVRSPLLHKAMRAEEIIQRMEQRYEAGHEECKPTLFTYQNLIAAWSRTDLMGSPQMAEQVLERLDRMAREEGHEHLDPNAVSCNMGKQRVVNVKPV